MDTKSEHRKWRALFWKNAVPAVMSMLLTSGIVLVDGLFIGRIIGTDGLAAVNLTVPILYLLMGITIMIAVGSSSLSTPLLGAKSPAEASRFFSISVVLVGAFSVLSCLSGMLFLSPIVRLLGARSGLEELTRDYLRIMMITYIPMMLNITFSIFLRSEGKPLSAFITGLTGNLINVVLDWLFIARFGWGVQGAALASAISASAGAALGLGIFLSGRSAYTFKRTGVSRGEIASIFANGSSEMISQFSVTISSYLFNSICLSRIGAKGVAAFTVMGYLTFIESMVLTGFAIGMAPLTGFNLGAKDWTGIAEVRKISFRAAGAAGGVTFLLAALLGSRLAGLYTGNDREVVAIAGRGFLLYSAAFLVNGYNVMASAFLTSLHDAKGSALISGLRGLILVVIFLAILPPLIGAEGIWLSVPLAEILTFTVALPIVKKRDRELLTPENSLLSVQIKGCDNPGH